MRPDLKINISIYSYPPTVQIEGKLFRNPEELWSWLISEADRNAKPRAPLPQGHQPHPLEKLEREWQRKHNPTINLEDITFDDLKVEPQS